METSVTASRIHATAASRRPTQNPFQRVAIDLPQKVKVDKLLSLAMRGVMPPFIPSARWTAYLSKGINVPRPDFYSLNLETNISEYNMWK